MPDQEVEDAGHLLVVLALFGQYTTRSNSPHGVPIAGLRVASLWHNGRHQLQSLCNKSSPFSLIRLEKGEVDLSHNLGWCFVVCYEVPYYDVGRVLVDDIVQ